LDASFLFAFRPTALYTQQQQNFSNYIGFFPFFLSLPFSSF
jgi:hypothetical protein